MCKKLNRINWAALLVSLMTFAMVPLALANQNPPGCSGTGGSISLSAFYADGVSDAQADVPLMPCETIIYQGNIGHAIQATRCNPEGGTVTITTPDGVPHNVTPAGGIPEFGPGQNLNTLTVSYTVRLQDVVGGTLTATINWVAERSHTGTNDTLNQPNLTTAQPNLVTTCPAPGPCERVICDPNATFQFGTALRRGTCVHIPLTPQTCSIAPPSATVCEGQTQNFTVSITPNDGTAPFTISWTKNGAAFDGGSSTITATAPAAGLTDTYIATVVSANLCTNFCQATLTANPNPTCEITGPPQVCAGSTHQYCSTVSPPGGTVTHSWSISGNGTIVGSTTGACVNVLAGPVGGGTSFTLTDNVTRNGCVGTPCRLTVEVIPCTPCVKIYEEVVCVKPDTTCEEFGTDVNDQISACGMRNEAQTQCSAFCFKITVKAVCADGSLSQVPLENVRVTSKLDLSGCIIPTTLSPGQVVECIIRNVTLCTNFTDIVTVNAVSAQDHTTPVSDTDSTTVTINPIAVSCESLFTSIFDTDTRTDNCVQLMGAPAGTPVTLTTTIHNDSDVPLDVTVSGLPPLVLCADDTTPLVVPATITIGPRLTRIIEGCYLTVSDCETANFPIVVSGKVTTTIPNADCACFYDKDGNPIMTTDNANDHCGVCLGCSPPSECRVTGGGQLIPGFSDQSCIQVNTIIYPPVVNGHAVVKITHGGQLGAPFSQMDCGAILGNACIRGQWQHTRHYEGNGNPRDIIDMDFHSQTPKGVYDSLFCACLGCCDPETGVFIPKSVGPQIKKFAICNPEDHKICGPQPRPAPANVIIWSGIGTIKPATDAGVDQKKSKYLIFRVYIEDRSEPGGGHPGGAVGPADIYCFQAWELPDSYTVFKKPDFTGVANDFRTAVAEDSCKFVGDLESGALQIGSLPNPTVSGRTAYINDCGPMQSGNHQIHPATGATCP